jgi:hypothetical protein
VGVELAEILAQLGERAALQQDHYGDEEGSRHPPSRPAAYC